MSEANRTIPTMVTKKRKRRSGFIYSTKKALERSRLSKEIAKGIVSELGSARKALKYPSELWSEIGVVDLRDCSIRLIGPTSIHSVDENEEERINSCTGNIKEVVECSNKVSII